MTLEKIPYTAKAHTTGGRDGCASDSDDGYRNLIYFNEVDKGGHFAAWEQPDLFAAELRAAFKSLR
jgi:pimeloyl-ACP methyl ester carboxylesterase